VFEQQLDHFELIARNRIMQRRRPVERVRGVDFGARAQQDPRDIQASRNRSRVQRRAPHRFAAVDRRPLRQQLRHFRGIARARGLV